MKFPLDQKIIGGYRFKVKTWYKTLHLGTDWRAKYVKLYAPTDGKVLKAPWGTQGGQWLYFEDNQGNIHRFGHLSRVYVKSGKVKEGKLIAKTGNSGEYTSSPHLHEDITKAGLKVNWHKISQFIDPEKFYQLKKEMKLDDNIKKVLKCIKKNILDYKNRINSKEAKKIVKWIENSKKKIKELEDKLFLCTQNKIAREIAQKKEIKAKSLLQKIKNLLNIK